MHSCIKFILLLFTYIPCVLSTLQSNFTVHPEKRTGCHKSISPRSAFVFFRTNIEPDFDFGIQTGYITYYPKALDSALRLDHFRPEGLSSQNECGWQKARSVHSTSWGQISGHRGDIYYKYSDLHWVAPNTSTKDAHWIAASPDHRPPHTSTIPRNDTLDRIGRILRSNEPAADVYQLATICLGYFCGLLGMLSVLLLARLHVDAMSKTNDGGDPEAIELATINVLSNAKLGSASEHTAVVEIPRNQSRINGEVDARMLRTPPPQYSVDDSSR